MADIITFKQNTVPAVEHTNYSLDVRLFSEDIEFTVHGVDTDASSKLKIANELERIARIIRTDVLTGDA